MIFHSYERMLMQRKMPLQDMYLSLLLKTFRRTRKCEQTPYPQHVEKRTAEGHGDHPEHWHGADCGITWLATAGRCRLRHGQARWEVPNLQSLCTLGTINHHYRSASR